MPTVVLTARDVAFLVDYAKSDAKTKALADCDREAKGDPEARAICMQKARDKFLPDVIRFDQDKQKKVSVQIYKRNDQSLKQVYGGRVEFSDETPDSVRIRFAGPESGPRPLFQSGRGLIKVPNNYSIEIEDPRWGKVYYSAKIGLVAAP